MYKVAICLREDDWAQDEEFVELQDAVDHINRMARYGFAPRAWINDKEVKIRNRCVVDSTGDRLSTNPAWHEIFAPEVDRVRPFPVNPQTYRDIAEANALAARSMVEGV